MDNFQDLRKKFEPIAYEMRKSLYVNKRLQSLGWVRRDGKITVMEEQYCYADVPTTSQKGDLFFADKSIRPGDMAFDKCKDYIDHILNHSYWSRAFVTRGAEDVYHNGAILSTEYPVKYIISSSCAIRYVHEFPDVVKTWNYLSQYFTNGDLRLILSHFVLLQDGNLVTKTAPRNHSMFSQLLSERTIRAVLEKDYEWFDKQRSMSFSGWYRGMTVPMPGGNHSEAEFMELNCDNFIYKSLTNTLGVEEKIQVAIPKGREKREKMWVNDVVEVLNLERKEHVVSEKGDDRQRKRRVCKVVRRPRSGSRRRLAAG